MTRRCSHCSHNGHNSRTCPNKGVKLFGVRLTDGIRKCASMGNLSHYGASGSGTAVGGGGGGGGASPQDGPEVAEDGYASEDLVVQGSASGSRERKKGVPWTEEEHRMFLLGLQKLGKGDWRGIARNYVVTRTPTQVASHAQKYFIRQTNATRRKRRSSLFDIIVDESAEASHMPMCDESEMHDSNPLPQPPVLDEECQSMESTNSNDAEPVNPKTEVTPCSYPMVFPAYFSPFFPYTTIPFWQNFSLESTEKGSHEIIKPTPIYSKEPIDVNELVGMSKLSIVESSLGEPMSDLSLKLRVGRDRQSAFHANPTTSSSDVDRSSSPVHAI